MATNKQKEAIKQIVESRGISTGQAMINAGYDPTTAKNPKNLTESRAWPELIKEYLPDDDVFAVHKNALKATKIITSHTEPDYTVDDVPTQLKAVELQYRVTGKLKENNVNVQVNVQPILDIKAE